MKRFNLVMISLSFLFLACQKEDPPQEIVTPEIPVPSGPSWELLQDADHLAKAYSSIARLNLDHEDQLWIGSDYRGDDGIWRKGLWNFDGLDWQFVNAFEQHFPHASFVERIVFDEANTLWFGLGQQFVGFDRVDFMPHNLPYTFENGKLQLLKRDGHGRVWMSIQNHLISHYQGEWSSYDLPETVVDIHAFESSETAFWTSTNEGIYVINEYGVTKVEEVSNSEGALLEMGTVQDIVYWPGHGLVFASSTGLLQMKNGVWQRWDTTNSILESNQIEVLTIDNDQQLWFGNKDGLYHFNGLELSYFKPPIIGHCIGCKPKVLDIAVDAQNRKWILSDDDMIFVFEE